MHCDHHDVSKTHSHHGLKTSSNAPFIQLILVLILTLAYFVTEVIGGFVSGSLALLADAGHMLADIGALGLALFASWFSNQAASSQRTYGYYRLEIMAAFLNGLFLSGISCYIVFEAYQRMSHPVAVQANTMFWVALGGILTNLISVIVLHSGQEKNLNLKGAYLHIVGDLLGSAGTVLAALGLITTHQSWIDPVASILIALLVLRSAWKLVIEAADILLEASPSHINVAGVKEALLSFPRVQSVHDLHIWSICSGKDALSAHVVVEEAASHPDMLSELRRYLTHHFGISHLTLQLEPPEFEEDEIHF